MAHPYFEQLQHLLNDVDLASPDIDCKHFFSGAAAYTHGHIFASLTPKGLALKFPEARCSELLAEGFAEPLRYFDKSPVKRGYVLFPEHEKLKKNELRQYCRESASAAKRI
jgi:TfoX/Sxy family transcriptional regulator of competence genes